MDPLSIAASAITVAALAASTCRAFADLRSLCKSLPGRLHALNNEVADIEVVLVQVATVFNDRAHSIPENQQQAIPRLLKQANAKLIELQSTIEQLNKLCDRTKIVVLQAHAWRKEQPKLRALQDDIKTVKCSLNIVLGASNSYGSYSFRLSESRNGAQWQAVSRRGLTRYQAGYASYSIGSRESIHRYFSSDFADRRGT